MEKYLVGYIAGMLTIGGLLHMFSEHTVFYKQGQVDALSGKIQFELKTNPDQTTEWESKEKQ